MPLRDAVRKLARYARARVWEQLQLADPEYLRQRHGMYGVSAFLQQCWNPTLTKEILVRYGAKIDPDSWPVGPNLMIHEAIDDFSNLVVGPHAHVGRQVFLDLTAPIIIEGSVAVGMRCVLLTHKNVGVEFPNKPMARIFPEIKKPIILRRGCSIGAAAIIHCGVEIGEDSVIGAGVVIDKDVPPRTIVTSSRVKANFTIPDRYWQRVLGAERTAGPVERNEPNES